MKPVLVVGITGRTCSGKSYICQKLIQKFNQGDEESGEEVVVAAVGGEEVVGEEEEEEGGGGRRRSPFTVRWLDCDKIAHSLYKPDSALNHQIAEAFGREIIDSQTGDIDRKKLGEVVFNDRKSLDQLSSLVWPELRSHIMNIIKQSSGDEGGGGSGGGGSGGGGGGGSGGNSVSGGGDEIEIILIDAAILLKAHLDDFCQIVLICSVPYSVALERAKLRGLPDSKFQKMYSMNDPESDYESRAAKAAASTQALNPNTHALNPNTQALNPNTQAPAEGSAQPAASAAPQPTACATKFMKVQDFQQAYEMIKKEVASP